MLAFGLVSSASTICARFSGESLFVFPIDAAASRMFASLAILLTVIADIPPTALATAVAFGLILSAAVIFARAFGIGRRLASLVRRPMNHAKAALGILLKRALRTFSKTSESVFVSLASVV